MDFETGDLILFGSTKSGLAFLLETLIQYCTNSKYSHCAIVVKDPTFNHKDLKGLYLLESTGGTHIKDVEDDEVKFGVQLVPLEERLRTCQEKCYYRKLDIKRDANFNNLLNQSYSIVQNKPYDINPIDWIKAAFNLKVGRLHKDNTFFCSALVSFVYVCLGLLPKDTDWTIMRPKDLGTEWGSRLSIKQLESEKELAPILTTAFPSATTATHLSTGATVCSSQ